MRRIPALVKLVAVISGVLALSAYARNAGSDFADADARAWLNRMQTAAQRLDYAGTFVYQQGSQVRISRITHVAHGRDEVEKLESLDGGPREYIRTNDDVLYYLPEAKLLVAERHAAQEAFPAILTAESTDLVKYYDLVKEGTDRIAGLACQIIVLHPKDGMRYGYRLWADQSTGLLLRAQTLSANGSEIEQITFTQVAIGNVDPARLKPSVSDIKGWRIENAVASPAHLSGLALKAPAGFSKIREVKRAVSDTADKAPGSAKDVSQLVFSDGVAAISVFIEPDTQNLREGSLQRGAMSVLYKRVNGFWITIVGEVPPAAIKQVADSVEFKSR